MQKEDIFELVVKHTGEVIPELKSHGFKPEETLKELGANSLDRTDILDQLMESLSLDIPRVELFGTRTIGDLVELLYQYSLKNQLKNTLVPAFYGVRPDSLWAGDWIREQNEYCRHRSNECLRGDGVS